MMPANVPACFTPDDGWRVKLRDVRLVDDQVFNRRFERRIVFPVEVVQHRARAMLSRCRSSPADTPQTSRPPITLA